MAPCLICLRETSRVWCEGYGLNRRHVCPGCFVSADAPVPSVNGLSVVVRIARRQFAVVLGPALSAAVSADKTIPCVILMDIPTRCKFDELAAGLPDGVLHALYMICRFFLLIEPNEDIARLLDGSLMIELKAPSRFPRSFVRHLLVSPSGSTGRVYVKVRLLSVGPRS